MCACVFAKKQITIKIPAEIYVSIHMLACFCTQRQTFFYIFQTKVGAFQKYLLLFLASMLFCYHFQHVFLTFAILRFTLFTPSLLLLFLNFAIFLKLICISHQRCKEQAKLAETPICQAHMAAMWAQITRDNKHLMPKIVNKLEFVCLYIYTYLKVCECVLEPPYMSR